MTTLDELADQVKLLRGELREVRQLLDGTRTASAQGRGAGPAARGPVVATAAELDAAGGDPVVKWTPKKWTGESFEGRPLSQCSPDFLDALASFRDWCAAQPPRPGKEKYAEQNAAEARHEAALARGWAARGRANPVLAGPAGWSTSAQEEDIPF